MKNQGKRVLGAVRQSKTRDSSVSPETQRSKITAYAELNDFTVTRLTEDLSRSGKTSCFKRPGLGPYLTDPDLIATWDVLVTTKLDRACRNTQDYLQLRQWAAEHGKRLVFLNNPELSTDTPAGKAMGTITAAFAEFERDMGCERRKETLAELAEQGRWPGGSVPYGWRTVQREGLDGWYLEPAEGGTADVLREMAAMSRDGKSNGVIQRWLNEQGHVNGVGKPWVVERVRLVLHSKHTAQLLGETDADGLAAALKARSVTGTRNRGERVGGSPLLQVAFCACGKPLYFQRKKLTQKHPANYYKCIACHVYVNAEWLESTVERVLLGNAGTWELTRRRLVPGDDSQVRVNALKSEIETLKAITGTESVVAAKEAEIAALEASQFQPDRYVTEPVGETVAQRWDALGATERGSFLRSLGLYVRATKTTIEMSQGEGPWKHGWVPVLGLLPPRGSLTGSGRVMWTAAA